jgi:hypothetical protein
MTFSLWDFDLLLDAACRLQEDLAEWLFFPKL